ncbi:hypothetical protein [Streptomyces collinus]|uniref:histidine kinase n=1 Tax=Streptomyces collinus (strain DSM 40733 / Tue 365) TaxID=1214242 RepID=S5VXR8_STRC3|nr:two-component sensor kinase [Streptomyces collinus Tu 365]UJA11331.1 two-component sensor kinase [Streptomyces collinus]UJA13803.1 two-component sensor kinase [Streptomyces collinus]
MLRAGDGDDACGGRPQPTPAALDALVAECREAGMEVTLDHRVADPAAVPASAGRTAYRIAQAALTNARKHAPGSDAVRVAGAPDITVVNSAPRTSPASWPGSG